MGSSLKNDNNKWLKALTVIQLIGIYYTFQVGAKIIVFFKAKIIVKNLF